MSARALSSETVGTLCLTKALTSEEDIWAVEAALGDLPGVHEVKIRRSGVELHFDPDLVGELQFYEAVKHAGFHGSTFAKAA
jgi:copper chaperone CopZ